MRGYDMSTNVAIAIYNALFYLLFPFLFIVMHLQSLFITETRKGNAYRFGFLLPPKPTKDAVWIHAVSVGEVAGVKRFVEEVIARTPYQVYLSTTTATGYAMAEKIYGKQVTLFYAPLDVDYAVRRVYARIQPKRVIVAEIEIWPNMLRYAHRMGIPLTLINGRIGRKELAGYAKVPFFFRPFFAMYSSIFAQSEIDSERMIALGMPRDRVIIAGNLKYDVSYTLDETKRQEVARYLPDNATPLIVAGSTHSPEEDEVFAAYTGVRRERDAFLVVVPRDIRRGDELVARAEAFGLRATLRTAPPSEEPHDVLIVNVIGELLYYYARATVAIMGGSFHPQVGGHNFLEAVYFKKPIIVGSEMHNFIDMYHRFSREGGIVTVDGGDEIGPALNRLLRDADARARVGEKAHEILLRSRGASERIFKGIFGDEFPS